VINDDAGAQTLAACGTGVLAFSDGAITTADTAAIAQVVALAAQQSGADIVLLASDRRGKELSGRVAARLEAGCLTDVKSFAISGDEIHCQRNAFGGAAIATEVIDSPQKVIAITPASFAPAEIGATGLVSELSGDIQPTIKLLDTKSKDGDAVDLTAAKVIVAIGQGIEEQTELPDIEALAKALDGVVACTKPVATDRKWLTEDRIIGLSGVVTKPDLAVLIGISGQVQFAVGIREAKTIICINTDENADMIKMSDYYYVADAKDAVAALKAKLV
jgi:electron transfer flavoprotein alpha subunit